MLWGKIVNGLIEYAPPEMYDNDGRVMELKAHEDFVNAGFKRVIMKKPVYNPHLQYLVLEEIEEVDEDIYIRYKVANMEIDDSGLALTYEQMKTIVEEEVEKNG